MTEHSPDKWHILKLTERSSNEVHYRVLGGWSGGYLDPDHWRLNSGITKVEDYGEYYKFSGESGSFYQCRKTAEGFTSVSAQVLQAMSRESSEFTIKAIPIQEFMEEFDESKQYA